MKRSVEIALGTIVLFLITISVLISVIWFYYVIYSRSAPETTKIGNVIANQTNETIEILKNITNITSK